jgi:spore coat polysaccharide biosynthesis predicted glycosyltransferase SpsG/CMP-N-acetylneuraminic acid synthetase
VKGEERVLAVVPARGGTDTVPYLNIKRLGDKPLLAHTLEAAQGAPTLDRVVVTTDDPAVAAVARRYDAEAPFLRPKQLAADLPSLKPVIQHAVREVEKDGTRYGIVVVLQATTPFRESWAIEEAIERLCAGGFDAVVSVTEDKTLNWRAENERLVPLFSREGRREDQDPLYKENGAVVVLRRAVLDGPTRFGEKVGFLVLDKRAGFTVHDLEDFWMAERLLRQPRILFRVDGNAQVGLGHVYRSLAIAEAIRESSRAEIAFLMPVEYAEGARVASEHGYPVRLAAENKLHVWLDQIRDFGPDILVNDVRRLDAEYLRELSHTGATTVNLVDTPEDIESTERYEQTIVSVMAQQRETPESFYSGPAYAILREQFRGREKEVRERPKLVLLSFGGSDPQGLTLRAAAALQAVPGDVEVVAVAGAAFSYRREWEALASTFQRRIPLINEAGGHIAELMLEADIVVGSGGMSVYEIAALGTPGVILGQNAYEDRRMRAFAEHGTIDYLGLGTEVEDDQIAAAVTSLLSSAEKRRLMSARGRALVDGLGARRAAEVVLERRTRPREAVRQDRPASGNENEVV